MHLPRPLKNLLQKHIKHGYTFPIMGKKLTGDIIMSMLKDRRDILRKFTVKKIGLFGSFANDKNTRQSDVDFLVEFEKPTFDNFMDLSFSLEKFLGKKVDLITKNSLSPYIRPHVEKNIRWYEV